MANRIAVTLSMAFTILTNRGIEPVAAYSRVMAMDQPTAGYVYADEL